MANIHTSQRRSLTAIAGTALLSTATLSKTPPPDRPVRETTQAKQTDSSQERDDTTGKVDPPQEEAKEDSDTELSEEQQRLLEALRERRKAVQESSRNSVDKTAESSLHVRKAAAENAVREGIVYLERVDSAFRVGFHLSASEIALGMSSRIFIEGESVTCDPEDIICELLIQGAINACWELDENPMPFAQKLLNTLTEQLGPEVGETMGPALTEVLTADPDVPNPKLLRGFGADVVKYGKKALRGHLIELALSEVSGLARGLYCSKDAATWFVIERYAIHMSLSGVMMELSYAETVEEAIRILDEYDEAKRRNWEDFTTTLESCWDFDAQTPLQNYLEVIVEGAKISQEAVERGRKGYEKALGGMQGPSPSRPDSHPNMSPSDEGPRREIRPGRVP